MWRCLPLVPAALGFLACSCPGFLAFLGISCIGVQFLCSQSICQLLTVSGVLHSTSSVSLQHPTAWGNRGEGPYQWRVSCLVSWHPKPSLQDICLPCVFWLLPDRISSGRKIVPCPWLHPSSPSE